MIIFWHRKVICIVFCILAFILGHSAEARGRFNFRPGIKYRFTPQILTEAAKHSNFQANKKIIEETITPRDPELANLLISNLGDVLERGELAKSTIEDLFYALYPDIGLSGDKINNSVNDQILKNFSLSATSEIKQFYNDSKPYILPNRIETVSVLSALPTDNLQYKKVYGREASAGDANDLINAALFDTMINQYSNSKLSNFSNIDSISKVKSDVIIILAHNNNGSMVMRDGTSLNIKETARNCAVQRKLCIFLSCNAGPSVRLPNNLGPRRKISIEAAIEIALSQIEIIDSAASRSVKFEKLAREISIEDDNIERRYIIGFEIIGGIVIVAILNDDG